MNTDEIFSELIRTARLAELVYWWETVKHDVGPAWQQSPLQRVREAHEGDRLIPVEAMKE